MSYSRKKSNSGVEDMEFPRLLKKKYEKIPMGVTQFCGMSRGEASFCLKFAPCLDFFWNSPMAGKSLINT